jgi:orotate phosphoribosyltransferase
MESPPIPISPPTITPPKNTNTNTTPTAYKGIPLATSTTDKLAQLNPTKYNHITYSFNRKEAKDHGEGGLIVGAPLSGKKVIIIDDVITAGTAMKEAIGIIKQQGGILVGVVVALDRMERMGDEGGGAIEEVRREYGVPVLSVVDLNDLIGVLGDVGDEGEMRRVEEYKRRYEVSS